MKKVFITGMGRSGTTLLEKLMHNHPNMSLSSQPFPYLFIHIKQKYYESKKRVISYPLNNYFLEGREYLDDFYGFLDNYNFTEQEINNIFESMQNYSGQCDPKYKNLKVKGIKGTFNKIYNDLSEIIGEFYPKENLSIIGSKEVYCEEFLPYILNNSSNSYGIIIIRDPRDIVVSMNYGKHKQFTGDIKPLLFNLRNWRKSVAFATYLRNQFNFKVIKYEDLVVDSIKSLNEIAELLNIDYLTNDFYKEGIKGQDGNLWGGNSSFSTKEFISHESICRFKTVLPLDVINYIETICYPEMISLKYDFSTIKYFDEKNIINFNEKYEYKSDFPQNFSSQNIQQEIDRYNLLKQNIEDRNVLNQWFIFEEVYYYLKNGLNI